MPTPEQIFDVLSPAQRGALPWLRVRVAFAENEPGAPRRSTLGVLERLKLVQRERLAHDALRQGFAWSLTPVGQRVAALAAERAARQATQESGPTLADLRHEAARAVKLAALALHREAMPMLPAGARVYAPPSVDANGVLTARYEVTFDLDVEVEVFEENLIVARLLTKTSRGASTSLSSTRSALRVVFEALAAATPELGWRLASQEA